MVNLISFWSVAVTALIVSVVIGVLSWFWVKRLEKSWGECFTESVFRMFVHAMLMIPLFVILLLVGLLIVSLGDTKTIEDYYGISEIRTENGYSVRRGYLTDRRLNVTWRDESELKSGVLDFDGNTATLYVWGDGLHKLPKAQ